MNCLVTGGSGFIGSNLIRYMNKNDPHVDIYIADYMTNGHQYKNIVDLKWLDILDPDRLEEYLPDMDYVFHLGAVSSTTEWNGELLMRRNYRYTVDLIENCFEMRIPIQYASSASVYGNSGKPLNLYAFFKTLVDDWVGDLLNSDVVESPMCVQGFRFFNVYGPGEDHKGDMASPYHKFTQQAMNNGVIEIFEGSDKIYRDFIHVDDVCRIMYNMIGKKSGIYDVGTGNPKSFAEVAVDIAKKYNAKVKIIPFPEHLKGHYQTNTKADMSYLGGII